MDMFMNMTSSMTNWWGSGDKEKKAAGTEQECESLTALAEQSAAVSATDGKADNDEDVSPPTSEADSENSAINSAAATPTEDAPGSTAASGGVGPKIMGGIGISGINEVSTKAIESAKNFGSFLFSVANKAGKTVSDTAKQLKHTVEENSILGDFNKEQEAFLRDKQRQNPEAAVPPWVGYTEEELMKQQILSLSTDRRNFLRSPPSGIQYNFDYSSMYPIAMATLAEDPSLKEMRFELVPKLVNEETFWKNYFYRVSLIKQSTQLSSLAQETSSTSDSDSRISRQSSVDDQLQGDRLASVGQSASGEEVPEISDSPTREFASDAFQAAEIDKAELLKGMKQLGMDKKGGKNEEEWEKELQQELQEYEVVTGGTNQLTDDNEWEKEIQQMLDS